MMHKQVVLGGGYLGISRGWGGAESPVKRLAWAGGLWTSFSSEPAE